jgi:hypothetical protein
MDIWAKIGYGAGHRYSWNEAEPDGKGGWREKVGGRAGTSSKMPAIESAQNAKVKPGSIVKLHEVAGGESLFFGYSGEGVSWG